MVRDMTLWALQLSNPPFVIVPINPLIASPSMSGATDVPSEPYSAMIAIDKADEIQSRHY